MKSRRAKLLELVAETFIASNRPVPSHGLAETLGVSAATVRSEFVALEEMGYLAQPHTSAGRVPTREGWRAYAQRFVPPAPLPHSLPESTRQTLKHALGQSDGDNQLRIALRFASKLSGYAAVVVMGDKSNTLEAALLSNLSDGRVLAVFVLQGGTTRELKFNAGFTPERKTLETLEGELRALAKPLRDVPQHLAHLAHTASPALSRLAQAMREHWGSTNPTTVMSEGASVVLGEPESNDLQFLRRLLAQLEQPVAVAHLAPGQVSVEVDNPTGISAVQMGFDGNAGVGMLAILGPTRMRYPQAIAVAKTVSEALGA